LKNTNNLNDLLWHCALTAPENQCFSPLVCGWEGGYRGNMLSSRLRLSMRDTHDHPPRKASRIMLALLGLSMLVTPLRSFVDLQPISFDLRCDRCPTPGPFTMERKGDIWTMKSPGHLTTFRILSGDNTFYRADANVPLESDLKGMYLRRTDDPDYWLFIPDFLSGDNRLWIKRISTKGPKWKKWEVLGGMFHVCGYFDSYEKLRCN
jgi:hypothetical protein